MLLSYSCTCVTHAQVHEGENKSDKEKRKAVERAEVEAEEEARARAEQRAMEAELAELARLDEEKRQRDMVRLLAVVVPGWCCCSWRVCCLSGLPLLKEWRQRD